MVLTSAQLAKEQGDSTREGRSSSFEAGLTGRVPGTPSASRAARTVALLAVELGTEYRDDWESGRMVGGGVSAEDGHKQDA